MEKIKFYDGGIHKIEFIKEGNMIRVKFYELMRRGWVAFNDGELWDPYAVLMAYGIML